MNLSLIDQKRNNTHLSFVANTACQRVESDAIILGKWLKAVLLACCCNSVTALLSFAVERSYETHREISIFILY